MGHMTHIDYPPLSLFQEPSTRREGEGGRGRERERLTERERDREKESFSVDSLQMRTCDRELLRRRPLTHP